MDIERELTGYRDNLCSPIREGDFMIIPEHNNQCCQHFLRCRVSKNKEHGWVLEYNGKIISGMGIASGYSVEN